MAERAFREFVDTNPESEFSGNAQYWYAETFRIRQLYTCLLYTSPSPRDRQKSRMPSSA